MSEGYEETPTTTRSGNGASGQTQTQAPSRGRPDLRGRSFPEQEALLRPPVQAQPAKPLAGNLTEKIAMEDGEVEEFAARIDALNVKVAKPEQVYKNARQKYLGGDPRMHTLVGLARGVDGTWPAPKLIAEVCKAQSEHVRGTQIDGYPTTEQLAAFLRASSHAALVEENKDLFGNITGRKATEGEREANSEHRAAFNACSEPFLGMEWRPGMGVNDELFSRLMRAEARLLTRMSEDIDARGPVVHPAKGAPLTKTKDDLKHWAGVRERHRGYKAGSEQGYHKTGSAFDLNYHTNPWMAVRSGRTLGGEAMQDKKLAAGQKISIATEAIDVIDRASLWVHGHRAELHASERPADANEAQLTAWASKVWERFNSASEAVATYFALGYAIDRDAKLNALAEENKKLIEHGGAKADETAAIVNYRTILSSLPARPKEDALARIEASMGKGRPWSKDPTVVLAQMGPDLQRVAKVMVRGNVSATPGNVRNPTLGLFDLQKELVTALVSVGGLHWGGCEFGKAWSGDMMHFDLGFVPPALK